MFAEESLWIRQALLKCPLKTGGSVLDIGSSSYEYRTHVQGHIARSFLEVSLALVSKPSTTSLESWPLAWNQLSRSAR